MEENPFELTPKHANNSPRRIKLTNVWSTNEKNSKLQGYLEISPEFWPSIKHGTHIRYITSSDEFKCGGFILKNPFYFNSSSDLMKPNLLKPQLDDLDEENENNKIGVKLQNSVVKNVPNYLVWVVPYEDIKQLFIKLDASNRMILHSLETTIESTNHNMKKITEYVKKLDERIKKLESKK